MVLLCTAAPSTCGRDHLERGVMRPDEHIQRDDDVLLGRPTSVSAVMAWPVKRPVVRLSAEATRPWPYRGVGLEVGARRRVGKSVRTVAASHPPPPPLPSWPSKFLRSPRAANVADVPAVAALA
jgi:hypothetical protein